MSAASIRSGSAHGAVVVAPDKFKGSLTAMQVAEAIAAGMLRVDPDVNVDLCPVADGGDGLLDAIAAGGFQKVAVPSAGPTGRPHVSAFAAKDGIAVVESADVLAVHRIPDGTTAPLEASSAGLGHVMRAALDSGCQTLVVGLGGSASTDGGSGM